MKRDFRDRIARMLLALCALALLGACAAGGPSFSQVSSSIPTMKPGEGRVYFYRTSSMFGAAIQPSVYIEGRPLGKSQPGGFFFVDLPEGEYVANSTTEVRVSVNLDVRAGRTLYVMSQIGMGLVAGRVIFSLESERAALAELEKLSYIRVPLAGGRPAAVGVAPRTVTSGPVAAPAAASGPPRRVTIDDLNGLLPPAK